MKNLSISSVYHSEFSVSNFELCCIVNDELCIFSDGFLFFSGDKFQIAREVKSSLLVEDGIGECSDPVYLGYSSLCNKVVIAFRSGDIISVDFSENCASHEGTIDGGLLAAGFSTSEELLAIVTGNSSLLVLNQDFDTVFEIDLFGSVVEPITVGWGKTETQFRGSEGKLKRNADTGPAPTNARDDKLVRLSWRGDDEFLVVSLIFEEKRILKVVSKDGTLVHSSEAVPGLESALSWRPNGSLIASSQMLPNKHIICFFEKNTLPHGQIQLEGDWAVRELLWSCDSSILAAILDGAETIIRLFTTSNYHWYHKYTITINEGEKLVSATWSISQPFVLWTAVSNKSSLRYSRYSFRWSLDRSCGASSDDEAFVAVIDGSRLLLTSFLRGIVPPPMCLYALTCSKEINAVGFAQAGAVDNNLSSNNLFVQLSDGSIYIYKYQAADKRHHLAYEIKNTNQDNFQLSWISFSIIMGCSALHDGSHKLCIINLPVNGSSTALKSVDIEEPITAFRRNIGEATVFMCTDSLKFLSFHMDHMAVKDADGVPAKCQGKLLALEMCCEPLILDSSLTLYAGPKMVATGVTSVLVYEEIVIATTHKHNLLIAPLASISSISERVLEPGARIVTVVPKTSKIVLQLPRGNLEVVQPRALTLRTLKHHLDESRYGEAYSIMRRERINLNLLCDHNPDKFALEISKFLEDVGDPMLLCNFIAELLPENITRTMYGNFYGNDPQRTDNPRKVDQVCSQILSVIDQRCDKDIFFLVALTSLVKQGNSGGALLRIKNAIDSERSGQKPKVTGIEGLKHVMYLIDIEQLFKVALGTYDLDLVMFVAGKSQKDPKEYVPFLSNLKSMEGNYQRYKIDLFLKRYEKALENLVKCPEKLDECLCLVESQKLYKTAMNLFAPESEGYKAVCAKFGEELTKEKLHTEAAYIFIRGGHIKLALTAFTRAGDWSQVLACANTLGYSEEQLKDLQYSLANSLRMERRYGELGNLLIDHADDLPGGISALCAANSLHEALRITRLKRRDDLIDTHVKPAALSAADSLKTAIVSSDETFKKQAERLRLIRGRKTEETELDWDDLASESSKGSSRGSRSTATRSAKNARKLQRKLVSLKEGGTFEDLALIASLHDLASQVVGLKSQVRNLNLALLSLNESSVASSIQTALCSYIDRITQLIPEIWRHPEETGVNATSNTIAAAFTNRTQSLPAPVQAIQPKLMFAPNIQPSIQWELTILRSE